jgi:hypothetical protein
VTVDQVNDARVLVVSLFLQKKQVKNPFLRGVLQYFTDMAE